MMNMRHTSLQYVRGVFLVVAVVAAMTALPLVALSQEEATVRVLNISALRNRVDLTDELLVEYARDISDIPSRRYPELETLTFSSGDETVAYLPGAPLFTGLVDVSGSLAADGGFNFTSVSIPNVPGKSDLVIVGFDGTVKRFDDEVTIEYDDRTVTTNRPVLLLPGDVMFLFVRETREMHTEGTYPSQGCG
ncbi:MAG: hypothetical protein JW885_14305 [Deltaproteobacteria bacterium]|nr:hypothetical protein [Candidatus Zymogenaceae bacterium]